MSQNVSNDYNENKYNVNKYIQYDGEPVTSYEDAIVNYLLNLIYYQKLHEEKKEKYIPVKWILVPEDGGENDGENDGSKKIFKVNLSFIPKSITSFVEDIFPSIIERDADMILRDAPRLSLLSNPYLERRINNLYYIQNRINLLSKKDFYSIKNKKPTKEQLFLNKYRGKIEGALRFYLQRYFDNFQKTVSADIKTGIIKTFGITGNVNVNQKLNPTNVRIIPKPHFYILKSESLLKQESMQRLSDFKMVLFVVSLPFQMMSGQVITPPTKFGGRKHKKKTIKRKRGLRGRMSRMSRKKRGLGSRVS